VVVAGGGVGLRRVRAGAGRGVAGPGGVTLIGRRAADGVGAHAGAGTVARIGLRTGVAVVARRGGERGHGARGARAVARAVHVADVPVVAGAAGGGEGAARRAAVARRAVRGPEITVLARVEHAVPAERGDLADEGGELGGLDPAPGQPRALD